MPLGLAIGAMGTVSLAAAAIAQPAVGIRQGSALNNLVIQITEYIGDCPETVYAQPEVTFVSPESPINDRRVRIYNRSVVGREAAYTDREYEDGGDNPYLRTYGSESFRVTYADEHRNSALAMLSGSNDMIAIVYDGGRRNFLDLEDGYEEVNIYEFTVNVDPQVNRINRDRTVTGTQVECEDGTSLAQCAETAKVNVRYSYCEGQPRSAWDRQVVSYVNSNFNPGQYILQQQGRLQGGDAVLYNDGSYYDDYFFNGRAGQRVTINLNSSQFDTYLWLIDPSGNTLNTNDDSNGSTNSEIFMTLPRTGRYQVRVNSYGSAETGAYTLIVR